MENNVRLPSAAKIFQERVVAFTLYTDKLLTQKIRQINKIFGDKFELIMFLPSVHLFLRVLG